nr:unnamed protein product [Naegleria fowleri]
MTEHAELNIVPPSAISNNFPHQISEGRLSVTSPLVDGAVDFTALDESKNPTTTTTANQRISSPKSPSSIQVVFNDPNNNNLNNNSQDNNTSTTSTGSELNPIGNTTIGKILDDEEFKIFSHLSKLGRGKHDASDSFAEDTPFYSYEEGFNSALNNSSNDHHTVDTTTTMVEEQLDAINTTTTIISGSSPSSNSMISSNNSTTSSGDHLTTQIQIFSNTSEGDLTSNTPIQITVDVVTTTTTTTTNNNNNSEEEHTTFVWQGSSVTTTTAEIQYHPNNIKSIVNTSVVTFEEEDEDEQLNAPPAIKQIIPINGPLRGSTVGIVLEEQIQIDEEHFHEISLGEIPSLGKSANQIYEENEEAAQYYESMSCFSCFAQPISYLWNSIFESNQTELTSNEKVTTHSEKNLHSNNQPQEV